MVKLKDIARETGLTISTVSKALNNSHEISETTTARVLATASAMGYRTKRPGGSCETKTIGAIFPEVRSHYFAELLHTLSDEFEQRGYTLITVLTKQFSVEVKPYIERILRHDLDGLIVNVSSELPKETLKLIRDSQVPAILLKSIETDEPYGMDSICIKDAICIDLAVEHLVELGHRKIGYLGEYLSDARFDAFCAALKRHQIELNPAFVKRGSERFEEGGYLRALELLREERLPTAVLTSYDQMAYGAMRAFREHGVRVPEEMSIIGFDNVAQGAFYPVPLTSVISPVEQMGITTVKLLMDAIRSPKMHAVQNVAMQGKLIIRESTCPPPADA